MLGDFTGADPVVVRLLAAALATYVFAMSVVMLVTIIMMVVTWLATIPILVVHQFAMAMLVTVFVTITVTVLTSLLIMGPVVIAAIIIHTGLCVQQQGWEGHRQQTAIGVVG